MTDPEIIAKILSGGLSVIGWESVRLVENAIKNSGRYTKQEYEEFILEVHKLFSAMLEDRESQTFKLVMNRKQVALLYYLMTPAILEISKGVLLEPSDGDTDETEEAES